MKKSFLAKRNALLLSHNISWGILALIFVLLVLILRLVAPNLFLQIVAPVFHVSDSIAGRSHSFFSSFGDTAKLSEQNETLVRENTALAVQNQALLKNIGEISSILDGHTQRRAIGIIAGVVARPPLSPYDTLTLASGHDDGVEVGMEAFGASGIPIGLVSSVLKDFSRITLFSAPGAQTSGWIKHKDLPVTLVGAGGGALTASVSRVMGVSPGDPVFVLGPGMLPIGTVARVEGGDSSPGLTIHVMPAQNLFGVSWVELRATGVAPLSFATTTRI